MSIRVSWPASLEPTVDHYLVQSAAVFSGPYATLATIANTPANPAVYDTFTNAFYYDDAGGTPATWYRLVVVDNLANSVTGDPFQAAGSTAPVLPYRYDDVLASARRRSMLPVSSLQTFTDDDLLAFCTEEMRNNLVPHILAVRQKYYEVHVDLDPVFDPLDVLGQTLGPYEIPYRAIGADPSLVQLIDPSGRPTEVARIDTADVPFRTWGLWIEGDKLRVYVNQGMPWSAVRMYYSLRTARCVAQKDVAIIQTVDRATNSLVLANVPATFLPVGNFDFVRANPNFSTVAFDQQGTLSGQVLSFDPASYPLPSNLAAGDQVSLSDTSAVIQLPVEYHPALAQAVACRMLEALGDSEGLQLAMVKLDAQMKTAQNLIKNRIGSNPRTVYNAHSPLRRWM